MTRKQKEAETFMRAFWHEYLETHRYDALFSDFDSRFTMIGTGAHEVSRNRRDALSTIMRVAADRPYHFIITEEWYQSEPAGRDTYLVFGEIHAKEHTENQIIADILTRFTAVCRQTASGWQLLHLHNSVADHSVLPDEFFPKSITEQSNQLLKTKIEQKTQELEQVYEALRQRELCYRFAMEATSDLVFEVDPNQRILFADSAKLEKMFGTPFEHLCVDTFADALCACLHPEEQPGFRSRFDATLQQALDTNADMPTQQEYRILHPVTQREIWLRVTMIPIRGKDKAVFRLIGNIQDITESKQIVEKLEHLSRLDALTHLYNRAYTEQEVNAYLTNPLHVGLLVLIDIDNFKSINDTFGHSFGDKVLADTANKLRGSFRADDIAGRIGGDEFVVFIKGVELCTPILQKIDKLSQLMRNTFTVGENSVHISASIGISAAPHDGVLFSQLYNNADEAMYKVKQNGKDTYLLYHSKSEFHPQKHRDLSTDVDLEYIKQSLAENAACCGAYQQSYESFQNIYRFIARISGRCGKFAAIMLVTILDHTGMQPPPDETEQSMQLLCNTLFSTLRCGDLFARYSNNQYILILVSDFYAGDCKTVTPCRCGPVAEICGIRDIAFVQKRVSERILEKWPDEKFHLSFDTACIP